MHVKVLQVNASALSLLVFLALLFVTQWPSSRGEAVDLTATSHVHLIYRLSFHVVPSWSLAYSRILIISEESV